MGQHEKGSTTFKEQESTKNTVKHFMNASIYQTDLGCPVQEDTRRI